MLSNIRVKTYAQNPVVHGIRSYYPYENNKTSPIYTKYTYHHILSTKLPKIHGY